MINITNNSTRPQFNLALEEYALKYLDFDDSIIILWQNEPSVIIGRNQNTIEEINLNYIKENNINVVRRLSGGGAVYHDLGNLNFTFIVKAGKDDVSNFRKFTEPVMKALEELGIKTEFSGRNDITIDGKKFSGNAQYYHGNKLLHHGTILFNSDLSVVQEALNVKQEKIESKGIKSVRSRVTNIYPYLDNKVSVEEFKEVLLKSLLKNSSSESSNYTLTQEDLNKINELMENRYSTWEWNYGESPEFNMEKSRRYAGGKLDLRLNVKKGTIKSLKIYGDFFGKEDVGLLEKLLEDTKYEEGSVRNQIATIDFDQYFYNITEDDFIDCLFY